VSPRALPSVLQCVALRFSFNAAPTTEIYTLSLHDALPIYSAFSILDVPCIGHLERRVEKGCAGDVALISGGFFARPRASTESWRSEEHTSELQSRENLVCRLLLEKKNKHLIGGRPKSDSSL